jgi:molecular chaperone HtpG
VKGLVDSELTLNVSRETIQHNAQLKFIAQNLEKKIKSELIAMRDTDRDAYVKFYKGFARQFKYGIYDNWGANKETLKDLVMFHSVKEDKLITFKEYVDKMPDSQKFFYYATGESVERIKELPLCEKVLDEGFDIICLTEEIDEFAIKVLHDYDGKEFKSISSYDETASAEAVTENKELTDAMKAVLGDKVTEVKLSSRLKTHPVCISTKGEISTEMEKVLNQAPDAEQKVKSEKVLEINVNHPIYAKLQKYLAEDKDKLDKVTEVLYDQALLIDGVSVANPTHLASLVCDLL